MTTSDHVALVRELQAKANDAGFSVEVGGRRGGISLVPRDFIHPHLTESAMITVMSVEAALAWLSGFSTGCFTEKFRKEEAAKVKKAKVLIQKGNVTKR